MALAAFERQMTAIAENWKVIEAVFRPNIITTLDREGVRMDVGEVFRIMFSRQESG